MNCGHTLTALGCLTLLLWPLQGSAGAAQADEEILDLLGAHRTNGVVVDDPGVLQRHGLPAQKGDRVSVQDLGNGRLRVTHRSSGKTVEFAIPGK